MIKDKEWPSETSTFLFCPKIQENVRAHTSLSRITVPRHPTSQAV